MVVVSGPALAMARREARSKSWLVWKCILLLVDGTVDGLVDAVDVVCK